MNKQYSQCCGFLALQLEDGDKYCQAWHCQNCQKECETRGYYSWEKPFEDILNKLQEILEAIKNK